MKKAPFSPWLKANIPFYRELAAALGKDYDYVSLLSTDSTGFGISISQHSKSVSNSTFQTEKGTVVRVRKDGLYSEYAFNNPEGKSAEELAGQIKSVLDAQLALLRRTGTQVYETGILPDEPARLFVEMETGSLPEEADIAGLVEMLSAASDLGMSLAEHAVDCSVNARSTHVSKLFLSANRELCQSYVFTEGSAAVITVNEEGTRFAYDGLSGLAGPEILEGISGKVKEAAKNAEEMLSAGQIVPGEYDIITTPGVTGLIAHEAFGHGVEMDMFVKDRALGKDYIGRRVGSDLLTMHEGAACEKSVTGYAFDDEGTLAGDVTEIEHGILRAGICDALSALRLGTVPTGNGKRQDFSHKVYTRMTNTIIDSGSDSLEDMIASVDYGYLLDGMESGMEDPKHWGIQCIVSRGYEIKDGKLTGKMVSPVVMTGYVPDLLGSISMVSTDRVVDGNGECGKGHKEWVKVADGGPYLKARARLG